MKRSSLPVFFAPVALLGPPLWFLARRDFPLKKLVTRVIDIPSVIPHSAAGIAVLGVVSRNSVLGRFAGKLGLSFIDTPAGIMVAIA